MMTRLHANKRVRGAAMVESAIAFVSLTLITFAIIQFALILNAIITVQYYAKEGSRYALVHYADGNFSSTSTVQTYLQNVVTPGGTIPFSALTVTVYPPASSTVTLDSGATPPSNTITVEVKYDLRQRVFFSGLIPGGSSFGTYTYYSTTFAEGT